jgi:hypothetical protein
MHQAMAFRDALRDQQQKARKMRAFFVRQG